MKHLNRLTWVALCAALTLTPLTRAQDADKKEGDKPKQGERGPRGPRDGQGGGPGGEGRRGQMRDRLEVLSEQLQLTAEQKGKLGPILKEETEKMRALRADTNLSQEDRRSKSRELRQQYQAKIKEVLTPEQQEKLAKIREQQQQNQGQGGGPGRRQGGRPPGGDKPEAQQ